MKNDEDPVNHLLPVSPRWQCATLFCAPRIWLLVIAHSVYLYRLWSKKLKAKHRPPEISQNHQQTEPTSFIPFLCPHRVPSDRPGGKPFIRQPSRRRWSLQRTWLRSPRRIDKSASQVFQGGLIGDVDSVVMGFEVVFKVNHCFVILALKNICSGFFNEFLRFVCHTWMTCELGDGKGVLLWVGCRLAVQGVSLWLSGFPTGCMLLLCCCLQWLSCCSSRHFPCATVFVVVLTNSTRKGLSNAFFVGAVKLTWVTLGY